MRSYQIDLMVREGGGRLRIAPRGDFEASQLPAFREKILSLAAGRWQEVAMDLSQARFLDPDYLDFFAELLNYLHGRNSHLVLAFRDEENWRFFRRLSNLFDIRARVDLPIKPGRIEGMRAVVAALSRRTGLRLSGGVALVLVVLIAGWVLTLVSVIRYQEKEIHSREATVLTLEAQARTTAKELEDLKRMVGPMRELGLLGDSLRNIQYDSLDNWVDYLDGVQKRKASKP